MTQWVQEMQTHFGEEFRLLTPSEFSSWRNVTGTKNVWRQFNQVICPVDSIQAGRTTTGLVPEKLETYNQERLGDPGGGAGWDLIICDEACVSAAAQNRLPAIVWAKLLLKRPHTCCCSPATPHQGKTAGFGSWRLLDRDEFIADGSIRRKSCPGS